MQPNATLTATQQNVLHHLAAGKSVAQTAEICGVHRNTIANWRRDLPAFANQLDEAIRERSLLLRELIPQAVEVLRTILHNEKASPSLRLRAALAVLKMAPQPELASFVQPAQSAPLSETPAQFCTNAPNLELEKEPEPQLASFIQDAEIENPAQKCTKPEPIRTASTPSRNHPCPCKSGLKYKRCCAKAKAAAA